MDLTKNITYKCDKCGRKMTAPGVSVPMKGIISNTYNTYRATYFKHICENCNKELTSLLEHQKRKFFSE